MRFVGREPELERLNGSLSRLRETGRGQFIAMRGRRRVGKSRLIEEFAQQAGCPYVFYTAVKEEGSNELRRFVDAIGESGAPAAELVCTGAVAQTWEAALMLGGQDATPQQPVIVVIDEFPNLAEKEPSIEAVLQTVWDRRYEPGAVMVIIVGSDEAMMEALTEQGRPLFDRPREMVVHPMSPRDVGALLDLSPAEAIDAYLIIGGFPVLALEWARGRDRDTYLADALADPTSFLVVSAERALSAEFPKDTQARQVLTGK